MTRITYKKLSEEIETSNLMMLKTGEIIFVEINLKSRIIYFKNIEGGIIIKKEYNDLNKAKRDIRKQCIELGLILNQEIRGGK